VPPRSSDTVRSGAAPLGRTPRTAAVSCAVAVVVVVVVDMAGSVAMPLRLLLVLTKKFPGRPRPTIALATALSRDKWQR
jgi:hypothetical protein